MSEKSRPDLTFEQLTYTSCKFGLGGIAGFQTRVASSGLQVENLQEISRIGLYRLPNGFSADPNGDEIANLPIAYRAMTLENNQLAITRSHYVGKDYSGRGGNYFVHGLMIPMLPCNVWPIDLIEWSGWKQWTDEDKEIPGGYLVPKVTVKLNPKTFDFEQLSSFVKADPSRVDILRDMVDAVFCYQEDSRSLVVVEDDSDVAIMWLACIQKCFPSPLAKVISLSTWNAGGTHSAAINAIHGETDFVVNQADLEHYLYLFDFSNGAFSKVDQPTKYSSVIVNWLTSDIGKLKSFYAFAEGFNYTHLTSEIESLLKLYCLRFEAVDQLSERDIIDVIEFVRHYVRESAAAQVLGSLKPLCDSFSISNNPVLIEKLILLYSELGADRQIADSDIAVAKLLVSLAIYRLHHTDFSDNNFQDTLRAALLHRGHNFHAAYADQYLTAFNRDQRYFRNRNLGNKQLALMLDDLVHVNGILKRKLNFTSSEVKRFLTFIALRNSNSINDLRWLLECVEGHSLKPVDAGLNYIKILGDLVATQRLSRAEHDAQFNDMVVCLNDQFKKIPPEEYQQYVRRLGDESSHYRFLEALWQASVSSMRDKISFHNEYVKRMEELAPVYIEQYRPRLASALWAALDKKAKLRQANAWVKSDCVHELRPNTRDDVLTTYVNALPIAAVPSQDVDAEQALAGKLDALTYHALANRLYIRNLLYKISNDDVYGLALFEHKATLKEAFRGLTKSEYRDFLSNFFGTLYQHIGRIDSFAEMLEAAYYPPYSSTFTKAYQKRVLIAPADMKQDVIRVIYWVRNSPFSDQQLSCTEDVIQREVAYFAKLKRNKREAIFNSVLKHGDLTKTQADYFVKFKEKVIEKRNTLFKKCMKSAAGALVILSRQLRQFGGRHGK